MDDCTFAERLHAFLDDELSDGERAELETHLSTCPVCPCALERLTEPPEFADWRPLLLASSPAQVALQHDTPVAGSESDQAFLDGLKRQLSERFSVAPLPGLRLSGDDEIPAAVGSYPIQSRLGSGGMGVVYRGYDEQLKRPVAVKVLRAGIEGNTVLRQRVQREAEAIARLRHPNIVSIYEVGAHEGRPFLVLEFVEGGTLARSIAGQPQPPTEAAGLVQVLARAIHFAHEQGIVHRDLKPSNILLSPKSKAPGSKSKGRGQGVEPGTLDLGLVDPRITDFGLAKDLNDEGQVSQTGDLLGTPSYMAPEQVAGTAGAIGPAADVYALGVILYELLTGRTPFRGDSMLETLELVRSREPTAPSRLQPATPRDLDTICLKCLHKEPARRYRTAQELADDLHHFLQGEPIQARPVSGLERFWKWVRRRPGLASALASALLFLLVGSITTTWFGIAAMRNAADAEQRAGETREQEKEARLAQARAEKAEKTAQREAARLRFDRGLSLAERGEVGPGLHWMLASLRSSPSEDRDFQRLVRTNLAAWAPQVPSLRLVLPHKHRVHAGAISADGKLLATGCHDGSVRLWDAASGELRHTLSESTSRTVESLAFSPDGRRVAAGYACADGVLGGPAEAHMWDVSSGKPIGQPLPHVGVVLFVAFNPQGTTLLTVSISKPPYDSIANEVHLWDAVTLRPLLPHFSAPNKLRGHDWSPDGKTIVTLSQDKEVNRLIRWDAATGARKSERTYPALWEYLMVPGPAGKAVITAEFAVQGPGGRPGHPILRQRDLETGKEDVAPTIHCYTSKISTLAVTPDGRTIVAASEEGILSLRDAATGQLQTLFQAHGALVSSTVIQADGKAILTASLDGTAKLWDIGPDVVRAADLTWGVRSTETGPRLTQPEDWVNGQFASMTLDRSRALVPVPQGGISHFWDVTSGWPGLPTLPSPWKDIRCSALSPDGKTAAVGSHPQAVGGAVSVWDTVTGKLRYPPLNLINFPSSLAFHPDGHLLATGDYQRKVILWDVSTGQPVGKPLAHNDIVLAVQFSPDGKTLATATANAWARSPRAQLWDVQTGQPIGKPMFCRDHIIRVLFSPDGKFLLTGCRDGAVRLWDTATCEPCCEPLLHPQRFTTAAVFSPDGRTFATGSGDGTARLWDTTTARLVPGGTFVHPYAVCDIAYSGDGRTVVVACADGTARLWDIATLKPIGPPVAHRSSEMRAAAFLPRGGAFTTVVTDGPPRTWPLPVPDDEPDLDLLSQRLQLRTGMQMSADGSLEFLSTEEWLALRRTLDRRAWSSTREGLDADWHDARARDAEQDGDTFGALWHLDRLVKERPEAWIVHARRARMLKRAGRGEEAVEEVGKARKLGAANAELDW